MWRWSACAFSQMGILFRPNIPRARIIHSSSLIGLKWKGTRMYMGAGGDGPHIWAYPTNTRAIGPLAEGSARVGPMDT